jgi:GH18 family chitinase
MPFKSKAQRKLFFAKAARGEISRATVAHWNKVSKGKKLPEYVRSSIAQQTHKKGNTKMAKRRKKAHKKAHKKASKGGWSAAKTTSYKRAKRALINAFNRKASGKVSISVG